MPGYRSIVFEGMVCETAEENHFMKSTGKRLGRPKGSESKLFFLDAHKGEIMNMLERGESVGSICEHFNVSKNTFYKYRKKFFRS